MYKLLGGILIILSGGCLGFLKSFRMKKRINSLTSSLVAFKKMSAEISFTNHRLERILGDISKETSLPLFFDTSLLIKEKGIKKAWDLSLNERKDEMALTDNDIITFKKFPEIFDYTGATQQKSFDTFLKLLTLSKSDAENEYKKTGKLIKSGGFLLSLLVVILLY